jgi:hypothetical protein
LRAQLALDGVLNSQPKGVLVWRGDILSAIIAAKGHDGVHLGVRVKAWETLFQMRAEHRTVIAVDGRVYVVAEQFLALLAVHFLSNL